MIVDIDSPLGDNALIARGGRPETPEKIIIRNKKLSVQRRTDNLFKKAMTCSAIMMKRMDYYRGTERRGYHMIDADMDEFLIAAVMISKQILESIDNVIPDQAALCVYNRVAECTCGYS